MEATVNETQKIKPKIHDLSAFKQVMESRSHPLEMVREAISNMMAPEVGASEVTIQHYQHPDYNASFIFKDDGIGMTFTGDPDAPGRLDRFIGLAFSKAAGLGADYWGWKGLGSKLMLNCGKLIIETWTGLNTDLVYRVEIFNPRNCLLNEPPQEPVYELTKRVNNTNDLKGTRIEIFSYDGGKYNYSFEELKNYLYLNTAIGLTRKMENLPKVNLNVNGYKDVLNIGFNYITEQNSWNTVAIGTPITKSEKVVTDEGKEVNVEVTLKGGFTLETGQFGLSPRKYNTGLRLSVKGIPYFQLPLYEFKGHKFNQYKDLCSFIIECDALGAKLNMDRSNISNQYGEDVIVGTFRRLTAKCFDEFAESEGYKNFEYKKRNEDEKSKASALRERQVALSNTNQEYVTVEQKDTDIKVLHKVPDAEHDTLALFWKLEALGLLPFAKFVTLEHTKLAGIDVIATYLIDEQSTIKQFESVEFEYAFSNFIKHGHNPKQTSMIICWVVDKPRELQKVNEYFYRYNIEGLSIPVYEIKNFPGLIIKRYDEIDI